jgi:hypothetical protein
VVHLRPVGTVDDRLPRNPEQGSERSEQSGVSKATTVMSMKLCCHPFFEGRSTSSRQIAKVATLGPPSGITGGASGSLLAAFVSPPLG